MDVRKKLVELLKTAPFEGKILDYWWFEEKIARIAYHLIANGVTVQEWIPVSESMPKEGDIVLCYMEFGEQRMAQWDESENCWAGQLIDYHKEQITHWMPLPEAPKGE